MSKLMTTCTSLELKTEFNQNLRKPQSALRRLLHFGQCQNKSFISLFEISTIFCKVRPLEIETLHWVALSHCRYK